MRFQQPWAIRHVKKLLVSSSNVLLRCVTDFYIDSEKVFNLAADRFDCCTDVDFSVTGDGV
jgi:hypothetical protein